MCRGILCSAFLGCFVLAGNARGVEPPDGEPIDLKVERLIRERWGAAAFPAAATVTVPDDYPRLAQFIKQGIVTRASARSWGCEQAAGEPNTEGAGDIVTAWASATQDGQDEWLELTYESAVKPVEVHVVETYNPGTLFKVTAVTESGMEAVLWKGKDPTPKDAAEGRGTSVVKVTAALKTNRIRIHLASQDVPGWNEIDAVGIKDDAGKMHWAKSVTASSNYASGPAPGWILDPAAALKYIEELEFEIERLQTK